MRKLQMSKMDQLFGTLTLDDAGQITVEGPEREFMQRWLDELAARTKLKGQALLDAFRGDFPGGSWVFQLLNPTVEVGAGRTVFGTIGWDGNNYVVKGAAISTKELASKIPSIEHYSGLSGAELVVRLPEYFQDTDKWARLV